MTMTLCQEDQDKSVNAWPIDCHSANPYSITDQSSVETLLSFVLLFTVFSYSLCVSFDQGSLVQHAIALAETTKFN